MGLRRTVSNTAISLVLFGWSDGNEVIHDWEKCGIFYKWLHPPHPQVNKKPWLKLEKLKRVNSIPSVNPDLNQDFFNPLSHNNKEI